MSARARRPSPTLAAAAATIGHAAGALVPQASVFGHSFEAPLDRIRPDPDQARRQFEPVSLAALAETLRAEGQLQPILLRPDPDARGRWVIVAGERRWRAAKLIGWTSLLAIEHVGDPELASLLENLQRVDLHPVEEARGIRRLLAARSWTQEQAARALGRSPSEVSAALRILDLPEAVLAEVLTSELPVPRNLLVELSRVQDQAVQARLAHLARRGTLTIRSIRAARSSAAAPGGSANPGKIAQVEVERIEVEPGAEADWGPVWQALRLVSRAASGEVELPEDAAATLASLREAIDALLIRRS